MRDMRHTVVHDARINDSYSRGWEMPFVKAFKINVFMSKSGNFKG